MVLRSFLISIVFLNLLAWKNIPILPEVEKPVHYVTHTVKRTNQLANLSLHKVSSFPVNVPIQKEWKAAEALPEKQSEEIIAQKMAGLSCGQDVDTYRTVRSPDFYFAFRQTVADGPFGSASTWQNGQIPGPGDQFQINNGHTVTATGTISVQGGLIAAGGELIDNPNANVTWLFTENIEVVGLWRRRPANNSIKHFATIVGINESQFVGGGLDVQTNDKGIWVMGGGLLDWQGTTKTPWTRTTAGLSAGATSATVQNATGWQIGDNIVICPTDEPIGDPRNWNDATNQAEDSYISTRFARRTIQSISGNTITWSGGGLGGNYYSAINSTVSGVYGSSTLSRTPEIINLTRNVTWKGTASGRTHMFIRNTQPAAQNIQYVEIQHFGPRKIGGHPNRPDLVSGRYGIHFHFGGYNSANSLVYGVSLYDGGNRGYVPHETSRINMSNNSAFMLQEQMFWWDAQETSHYITWNENIMAASMYNGRDNKNEGMILNMGEENQANRNVGVYAMSGDPNGGGVYAWHTNTEGIWFFNNNEAHSSPCGLWVWQNTGFNHTINGFIAYNCFFGINHGAYINSYAYTGGHFYRAMIFNKATSGNSHGVVWKDLYIDAGGKPHGMEIVDSPVPGGTENSNKVIQCTFRNHATAGILFNSAQPPSNPERQYKFVDLINNDHTGILYNWVPLHSGDYQMKDGWQVRVQTISGANYGTYQQGGSTVNHSGFADFASNTWGSGGNGSGGTVVGLRGDYYNGYNFNSLAFSRQDPMLIFDGWRQDENGGYSSDGVHHLIGNPPPSGTYSVKWFGRVMPQYSGNFTFILRGNSSKKMWITIGGTESQIINADNNSNPILHEANSTTVNLIEGQLYDIRIELKMDVHPTLSPQGIIFMWNHAAMGANKRIVPQTQLFPPAGSNTAPTVTASADQDIILPVNSVNVSSTGNDAESGVTYLWERISGPLGAVIVTPTASGTTINALVEGTYQFRVTVTDAGNLTANDVVQIRVFPVGFTGDNKIQVKKKITVNGN